MLAKCSDVVRVLVNQAHTFGTVVDSTTASILR